MIFNYGYGCCAFAHNICGSQPMVPNGIPDTSKLLSPELFINPRYPVGSTKSTTINVPSSEATIALEREVPTVVLEADTSEAGKNLSASKVGLGNEPDSSTRVIGESEEPDVIGGS